MSVNGVGESVSVYVSGVYEWCVSVCEWSGSGV